MGRLNHHLVWANTGKALARLNWWADSTIILLGQALGRLCQDCTDGQTQPSSCLGKHWEDSGKTALLGRLNYHLVWARTGKALWRLWQDCTDGQTQPSSCVGKHWEGSVKALARLHWWADSTITLCGQALGRLWQDCTDGQTHLRFAIHNWSSWASSFVVCWSCILSTLCGKSIIMMFKYLQSIEGHFMPKGYLKLHTL